ncbi:MAG: DUF4012 domain-containing protein [Patescibacteria group bacterium]|jgi:hypothetical protein
MKNKKVNFIKPNKSFDKSKKSRKVLWYSLGALGVLVLFFVVLVGVYWGPTQQVIRTATTGKDSFLKAQDLLLAQDFSGAQITLQSAIEDFQSSQKTFKKFLWLEHLPWIGTQVKAVDNLFSVGITTGQSIKEVASVASSIVAPLKKDEEISLAALTPEETHQLLANIYDAKPKLEEAKISITQAVAFVDEIPSEGLIKKLSDIIDPIKDQVPQVQSGLDQAIQVSQILPLIAGYPDSKTYLFLLENNAELAPSGGFIGTYGILKIKDGDITSFATDNVYNLDVPAEAWLDVEAPWPVATYNAAPKLFLRGASWSPDFPTTGKTAQWFYQAERGPEKKIDGTIAITPTFIESLLTITGEVQVDGLTFTSDNFTEVLQDQVERGFLRQGASLSERKEIIGDLSTIILDDVLSLPKSRWFDLWKVIQKNIEEKQILLYSNDDNIQSMILKQNWGGEIQNVDGDYLTVIDANLASLKTDTVMQRSLDYKVHREGDTLIADVNFTYTNQGTITWKTTRYRTYVRVYVPQGSTLISSEGAMVDCKKTQSGNVETTEELNKTVFGAFVCTEPGESKTFHLQYALPSRITDQVDNGQYQLLIQKQAGTTPYSLTLNLDFGKKLKSFETADTTTDQFGQTLSYKDTLSQDRYYTVKLL